MFQSPIMKPAIWYISDNSFGHAYDNSFVCTEDHLSVEQSGKKCKRLFNI